MQTPPLARLRKNGRRSEEEKQERWSQMEISSAGLRSNRDVSNTRNDVLIEIHMMTSRWHVYDERLKKYKIMRKSFALPGLIESNQVQTIYLCLKVQPTRLSKTKQA